MELGAHYAGLAAGYSVALAGWLAERRALPGLWPRRAPFAFAHPWRELGWALAATAAVIGLGQLYARGWRFAASGSSAPFADAANQLLIFAPFPLLLVVRRHPPETAWLPTGRIWLRVAGGLLLALLAVRAFTLASPARDGWSAVLGRLYAARNFGALVQVLLEDVAIAILFVRLRAAIGTGWTIVLVAVLFAAAHVPALLAGDPGPTHLVALLLDAALGTAVLTVLQRSADVWWFWQVQFAMDMMQFSR